MGGGIGGWCLFCNPSPTKRLGRPVWHGSKRHKSSFSGVRCKMRRLAIYIVCCLLTFTLESCFGRTDESLAEVKNGDFKIVIRSQEVHNSGLRNIDACVADVSSHGFPGGKAQCFLHGFDFSGLSFRWQSQRDIEVSFNCGNVSLFRNYAIVPHGLNPASFHVTLREECSSSGSKNAPGA
jgi:hypothetical protein